MDFVVAPVPFDTGSPRSANGAFHASPLGPGSWRTGQFVFTDRDGRQYIGPGGAPLVGLGPWGSGEQFMEGGGGGFVLVEDGVEGVDE